MRLPLLKRICLAVGVFLAMVMFAGFVYRVVSKVKSGRGLDTYLTPEGVEFNYIGTLILLMLIPIALLLGWGVRWWQLREERDFKKQFKVKE
jgi:hypothetical protein